MNRPAAPIDSASPAPSSDKPFAQRAGDHHRDVGKFLDLTDVLAEPADRDRFIVAGFLPGDALHQLVVFDQRVEFRGRRGDREARRIPHRRAHQHRQVLLVEHAGLERAPRIAREDEVMIVDVVLRDGDAHQQIERLDRRDVLPQPLEEMVGLVAIRRDCRRSGTPPWSPRRRRNRPA